MSPKTLSDSTWHFCVPFTFKKYQKIYCVYSLVILIIQFSSVAQSCLTLCNPMDCSMPGLHVHHQHPELAQTHVHWVGDAFQPFNPLLSPSLPALNLSQHQGLFQWVSSSHQVAKVLSHSYSDPIWESYNPKWGFLGGSDGKESACNAGEQGSIPGSGRYPGEWNSNALQYSCLENPLDGEAW